MGRSSYLHTSFVIFTVLFLWLGSFSVSADPITLVIGNTEENQGMPEFHKTWCPKNSSASRKLQLPSDDLNRFQASALIMCHALIRSGQDFNIRYQDFPNYTRILTELKKGTVSTMLDFPWYSDAVSPDVRHTDVVIEVGMFEKGFYVRPDDHAALQITDLQGLRALIGVSSKNWYHDWAVLQEMEVQAVDAPTYQSMIRMVHNKRVRFLMGEFPRTPDLSLRFNEIELIPIKNIKIVIPVTRHIVISRIAPYSKEIHAALQVGIESLKADGTLTSILALAGFPSPHVRDWETVCCAPGGLFERKATHERKPPLKELDKLASSN